MITNSTPNIKTFQCKSKLIMNYLVYDKLLPVFSVRDGIFYFIYNENLKKIIKEFPIWLTILVASEGLNKNLDKE